MQKEKGDGKGKKRIKVKKKAPDRGVLPSEVKEKGFVGPRTINGENDL